MAGTPRDGSVIGRRRGRVLLIGAVALAILLVVGRWLAVETAERAWAATIPAGGVYLDARSLARLARVAIWLLAAVWGAGNLYIVYRAIGSVQMPRRVGNLEIVEAVPQPVLLALAIGSGLLFGFGLAWGTGEWWLQALLARGAPRFGLVDPVLQRDLGYYVGELPWAVDRQQFFQLSTVTAVVLVAFLYFAIGSLRWQRGRVVASPHARAHVGVLLVGAALGTLWGALLDPAEVVAGMHGTVGGGAISVRLPGAPFVAAAAGLAALTSLAWAGWDRARWLAAGWTLLGVVLVAVYGLLPSLARAGPPGGAYPRDAEQFTYLAFGTARQPVPHVPPYLSMEQFLAPVALWSPDRVAAAAVRHLGSDESVGGVTLSRGPVGGPLWIVAPAPDDTALPSQGPLPSWARVHRETWASARGPLGFVETDSGLRAAPLPVTDSQTWFGQGFAQYAVRQGGPGIPLDHLWRRVALAWVLQSPEIARNTLSGERLLWRRTAEERFSRLAPFADFETPEPLVSGGALWWVALGYVSAERFPLVEAVDSRFGSVGYLRAGIVGAMRATSGETRFWLLPRADSLTAAWARLFAPLVAPAESMPPALAAMLPFPGATFAEATRELIAASPDSDRWRAVAREPFELTVPEGDSSWLAQAFVSGTSHRLAGFLFARTGAAGAETALRFAEPPPLDAPPQLLVGAGDTVPGPLRLWEAAGRLASVQARFIAPRREAPRLERVFVTWGDRQGEGASWQAALRDLLAAGPPGAADTTLAGRWTEARALFAALDAALADRDFERFAQVYRQLADLLGLRRGVLAPPLPSH